MMRRDSLSSKRDANEDAQILWKVRPCRLVSIRRHSGRVLHNFQGQAIHVGL